MQYHLRNGVPVEPSLLALGHYHLAVAAGHQVTFYELGEKSKLQVHVGKKEEDGSVRSLKEGMGLIVEGVNLLCWCHSFASIVCSCKLNNNKQCNVDVMMQ